MSGGVIRWEDPPPPQRSPGSNLGGGANPGHWAAIAGELRARPGVWGLVQASIRPGSVMGTPANIRRGGLAGFKPAGAFESVYRLVGDEARCYARYVGEPTDG